MNLDQLRKSLLVVGPGASQPSWDAKWRLQLVKNLEILARQLWRVGVEEIFVDGSFVEAKDHPNDIDGYFVCDEDDIHLGRLEASLAAISREAIWNWDRVRMQPHPDSTHSELPMWHRYRVSLFPHYRGNIFGFHPKTGKPLEYPAAFRWSFRADREKGIVRLEKSK